MVKKATLVAVSFLSLFLELCFIRWVPAHVYSVAFFTNIILIAAFLGLGLGLLLTEKRREFFNLFPLLLICTVLFVILLRYIQVALTTDTKIWFWSYYYGNRLDTPPFKISIIGVLGFVYFITMLVFIPVGQKIGRLMKEFAPLYAYSLNILGSLLGVIFFGAISFFRAPAFLWFSVVAVITVFLFYRSRWFFITAVIMTAIVAMVGLTDRRFFGIQFYGMGSERSLYSGSFRLPDGVVLPEESRYWLNFSWGLLFYVV